MVVVINAAGATSSTKSVVLSPGFQMRVQSDAF